MVNCGDKGNDINCVQELLVSIIVPIYNVEKYVDECVESIVKQSYKNLEILLIDDGSKDSSADKVDRWAKCDKRITVVHQKNQGMSGARNAGLDLATGEYIFFVDSDDYIADNCIEKLITTSLKEDADVVMCKFHTYWPNEMRMDASLPRSVTTFSTEQYLEQLYTYSGHYSLVWNKLYRRRVFEGIRFETGKRNEDARIMLYLMQKVNKVVHIPAGLYFYRQRKSSIMNGVSRNVVLNSELDWIGSHIESLKKMGYGHILMLARKLFFNKIVEFYMYLDKETKRIHRATLKVISKELLACTTCSSKTKMKILFCTYFPVVYSLWFNKRTKKGQHMYFD